VVFVVNLVGAIVICQFTNINLPWWAVLIAIFMAFIFILPIGIITAIANTAPGLNIITEFVIGYMLPGRPLANVTFKTYGYISMAQAITFVGDLKLGHYMKIPPRDMFIAQTAGTVLAGLMNVSTAYWIYGHIKGLCQPDSVEWQCSSARVFYSASIIWGVIGPAKMFGPGAYYNTLMWGFVIGAIAPVPFWLLSRRYPNSFWKYAHIPVLITATANLPPTKPFMYPMWFLVGFCFQFVIFRYRNGWWSKFNYVFSAAMDSGVAISGLVMFFAFQYWGLEVNWWGTQDDCPTFKKL